MSTNLTIEDIQDILKIEFEFTHDEYLWSTWIFPDGSQIDILSGDVGDSYAIGEHSYVLDYLTIDVGLKYINVEKLFETHCVKVNYTYPYIYLPINKPTYKQWSTIEKVINSMVENPDLSDRVFEEDFKDSYKYENAIVVFTHKNQFIYDISLYSPREIVKELKRDIL